MGDGLCGVASESWGACGQCLVSSPSCPMSGTPSALLLRAQHACPFSTRVPSACRASGPVSMVTRSHFPSPGCSRQLSGGRCRRCPSPMGNRHGWAPQPWAAALLPFSPRGGAPCPCPLCVLGLPRHGCSACLTLGSPRGDEGCLGHPETPATAELGGGIPAAWPGEGSGARSRSCWEHHGAQGLCPGSSWCHGASKVPVLTVSQGMGWAWPCCVPPSLPAAAPSPWHDTALYPALHLGAAYYHFPSLAIPGDKFFLRSF